MDHYADDLAEPTQHLDLHDAIHIGHSAGGGEVARYVGRRGESRVAKVVLVSAVAPSVLQTDANPAGAPKAAFEGLQAGLAANRSEFYRAVASGPFYNFRQPGVQASEAVIANWWRQGMMGGAKGQCAERHAEDLPGLPARDADHPRRRAQQRPAGVHPVLIPDQIVDAVHVVTLDALDLIK